MVIIGFGIYTSLHPLPAYPENFMPFFVLGWILIGVLWMLYLRWRNPRKLQLIGKIVFLDTEPEAAVPAAPVPGSTVPGSTVPESTVPGPTSDPPPAGSGEIQPSPG
jgi:hypothetical protein